MAPRSLHEFRDELAEAKLLARIGVEVDARLELSAIAERQAAAGGPALLFERVAGKRWPVAANLLTTEERLCRALGVENLGIAAERIAALWRAPSLEKSPGGWLSALKLAPQWSQQAGPTTRLLKTAPCQQVVQLGSDVDLTAWPIPQHCRLDAGPALHRVLAVTRDPATGELAESIATLQVLDARSVAVRWPGSAAARHLAMMAAAQTSAGQASAGVEPPRLSVAFVLGGDLCQQTLAGWPLPPGLDTLAAGALLRGRPLELARARTCDLDVSAEAEIVCEGFIEPVAPLAKAGVLGNEYGFCSPPCDAPRVQLTAVTHRANPCLPVEVVGTPAASAARWKGAERLLAAWLPSILPEAVDLALPACGGGRVAFVSLRKAYPQHARQAASAVWGGPPLRHVKLLVLVDAGVNVHEPEEVWRQVAANAHPGRDAFFHAGPADPDDHASPAAGVGAHLGLDATAKLPGETSGLWPLAADRGEAKDLVARRWQEYGLG